MDNIIIRIISIQSTIKLTIQKFAGRAYSKEIEMFYINKNIKMKKKYFYNILKDCKFQMLDLHYDFGTFLDSHEKWGLARNGNLLSFYLNYKEI